MYKYIEMYNEIYFKVIWNVQVILTTLKLQYYQFFSRDTTQSTVLLWQVVSNVEVSWSHRLEFFENNFTVS